jgi:hypothetical protein
MSYIIKPKTIIDINKEKECNLLDIPVKNFTWDYLYFDPSIYIYQNVNQQLCKLTSGIITQPFEKSFSPQAESEVNKGKRKLSVQFPLCYDCTTMEYTFNKRFLFQFPSLNTPHKIRLTKYDMLYKTRNLRRELDFLYNNYIELLFIESGMYIDLSPFYRFVIHRMRELFHTYPIFPGQIRKHFPCNDSCSLCGFKHTPFYGSGRSFFELHETLLICLNEDYKKIELKNFIIVCPNCHKIEHEKLKKT